MTHDMDWEILKYFTIFDKRVLLNRRRKTFYCYLFLLLFNSVDLRKVKTLVVKIKII